MRHDFLTHFFTLITAFKHVYNRLIGQSAYKIDENFVPNACNSYNFIFLGVLAIASCLRQHGCTMLVALARSSLKDRNPLPNNLIKCMLNDSWQKVK